VPLLAIAVFAAATGSHLLPSSNHINLVSDTLGFEPAPRRRSIRSKALPPEMVDAGG
jgi:hypothetical protein